MKTYGHRTFIIYLLLRLPFFYLAFTLDGKSGLLLSLIIITMCLYGLLRIKLVTISKESISIRPYMLFIKKPLNILFKEIDSIEVNPRRYAQLGIVSFDITFTLKDGKKHRKIFSNTRECFNMVKCLEKYANVKLHHTVYIDDHAPLI